MTNVALWSGGIYGDLISKNENWLMVKESTKKAMEEGYGERKRKTIIPKEGLKWKVSENRKGLKMYQF